MALSPPHRTRDVGMIASLARVFATVSRRRRLQGLAVLALMLVGAAAELLTLGAVLPLITLLANPAAVARFGWLQAIFEAIGLHGWNGFILGIAVLFCIVVSGAAAIRITLAWASQKYVFRLGHDFGCGLYQRVLYQPYVYHVARDSSQVVSAIGKVQQVLNQVMLPVLQGLTAAVIAVFILGGLVLIDASVALSAIGALGAVYIALSWFMRRRLQRNSKIIAAASTQRIKTVQEGLGGIRDVLVDQTQPMYLAKFVGVDDRLRQAQAANAMVATAPRFVIEALGMIMIAGLALALSLRPGGLIAALPTLGALALGAQRLLPLLQLVYNGWTSITGSRESLLDVLVFLEKPLPDIAARKNIQPLPFQKALELRDVSFRYGETGPLVVRDLNLTIRKGARVGVVGKTGSGKSTIVDLIMGLLDPVSGEMLVDGRPLAPDSILRWQRQIAHVPQHIFLADASIAENIAFGVAAKDIDMERVREVARQAELNVFVEEQEDGYNSVVGERGVRLSGGQRQRIGIARALYKQPSVLILDEATSALDDITEASVIRAIGRLGRHVTVLMIAHRTTTLRGCDLVFRIERGELVAQGSYDEVLGAATAHLLDDERDAGRNEREFGVA